MLCSVMIAGSLTGCGKGKKRFPEYSIQNFTAPAKRVKEDCLSLQLRIMAIIKVFDEFADKGAENFKGPS